MDELKKKVKVDKAGPAERVKRIFPILKRTYPDAGCTLNYENPLQLLIATILAAQCTDERVNIVTKDLFTKYKSASDWDKADVKQIEKEIKSTGFYHNKAISIKRTCRKLSLNFDGKVPNDIDGLLELNGVGRKTANVILGNVFGRSAVICDTHVIRLSRRLQLSKNRDPVKLEFDLMEIVPEKRWTIFCHLLLFHGRSICKARRPDCAACPIARYCPAANKPELW